jgi:hypothetical protein
MSYRAIGNILKVMRLEGMIPPIPAKRLTPSNNTMTSTTTTHNDPFEYEVGFYQVQL